MEARTEKENAGADGLVREAPFSPQVSARPFHVMAKPTGPACNIACRYCFYLEKAALWEKGEAWKMPPETLERFIRDYLAAQPGPEVSFAWQGGEPTLLGVDFFRRVVALQERYGEGRIIQNALQTNGLLLDAEWGQFLRDHRFLVGVSLDGPEQLHDAFRQDRAGRGTWARVVRGIETLQHHGVEFNSLTCLNRVTAQKPDLVYRALRSLGIRHMQFIPVVERLPGAEDRGRGLELAAPEGAGADGAGGVPRVTPWSVRPEDFGGFLTTVFDRWIQRDVGRIFIQTFETALGKWLGLREGGLCVFAETCGRALALEHDGSVYSCDHYVYPEHRLGNLRDKPLADMVDSPEQIAFGRAKAERLPRYCRACPWLFACHGECPKHRFVAAPDGEPGLNYLCSGFRAFFAHADPYLRVLAGRIRAGLPPECIREKLRRGGPPEGARRN